MARQAQAPENCTNAVICRNSAVPKLLAGFELRASVRAGMQMVISWCPLSLTTADSSSEVLTREMVTCRSTSSPLSPCHRQHPTLFVYFTIESKTISVFSESHKQLHFLFIFNYGYGRMSWEVPTICSCLVDELDHTCGLQAGLILNYILVIYCSQNSIIDKHAAIIKLREILSSIDFSAKLQHLESYHEGASQLLLALIPQYGQRWTHVTWHLQRSVEQWAAICQCRQFSSTCGALQRRNKSITIHTMNYWIELSSCSLQSRNTILLINMIQNLYSFRWKLLDVIICVVLHSTVPHQCDTGPSAWSGGPQIGPQAQSGWTAWQLCFSACATSNSHCRQIS